MSRNVVISALGFSNPPYPEGVNRNDFVKLEEHILQRFRNALDKVLPDKPDLIVFPEVANRFCNDGKEPYSDYIRRTQEYYKHVGDHLLSYLSEVAKSNHTNIAYSAVRYLPERDRFRNSTVYLNRNGEIAGIYDKNHPVVEENTLWDIEYGKTTDLIELDIGKVATVICFDLNFDDLLYAYKSQHPDLVVFSSAYHGGLRQEQWAYLCRSYFVGAVLGTQTRILDPFGRTVASSTNYQDYITAKVNLDYVLCHLDYNEGKLIAAKKKYGPSIEISDPGYVGSVMLTSNMDDRSAEDVVKEFEIEKLDDYFARVIKHREEHM